MNFKIKTMLYNNQSNKISKKTNKLINYTQEEMCFNVEYSMEYLLRELNYQYLVHLKHLIHMDLSYFGRYFYN